MKIILGSVVKGFQLKQALTAHLKAQGHEIIDVGCHDTSRYVKFTSIGQRVARALQTGAAPLAINCCGSGAGAAVSAGKHKGVIAVVCESVATARLLRVVMDGNCLCMGESIVTPELACQMADAFLGARFQDMPNVPPHALDFWRQARDELKAIGPVAAGREIETLG